MPKLILFVDEGTGQKRHQQQRPEGEGEKFTLGSWCGWEVYRCNHEECAFDTLYADAFDVHYYQKHELPSAQEQMVRAAAEHARQRAERVKPDRL